MGPFSSAPHAALAFIGSFDFITASLQKFVNFSKFWRPRSRLYRSRFLQVNTLVFSIQLALNFAAFVKFHKICALLHRSIPKL